MYGKKLAVLGIISVTIMTLVGCGGISVPEAQIPNDLATYLYQNTPEDGINQTADLQVVNAEPGKETKNKDGSVVIPVKAGVQDLSYYNGVFNMTYEKNDDVWELKDVSYEDRDNWEITPVRNIEEDVIRDILVGRGGITFAGDRIEMNEKNISNIVIDNMQADANGNSICTVSFDVSTQYVIYHTKARITVGHDINGYNMTGAVIDDYECELTENYAFDISDAELINMLSDKALLVGDQSVSLDDVTKITERADTFNEKNLTMTIVAAVNIKKESYDATADIYYTYRISDDGLYWMMDSYHGTNFKITEWKDLSGLYMGYVGSEAVSMEVSENEGSTVHAVLMGDTASSERELVGKIDEDTLRITFKDPETDKVLLEGSYSADLTAFMGDYGKKSSWALISQSKYREAQTGEEAADYGET